MQQEPANIRDQIVASLANVQQELAECYQKVVEKYPLAAEVPAIREMQRLQQDVQPVMQAISRLRGLE